MSTEEYEVVYIPEEIHNCKLPDVNSFRVGTVIKCTKCEKRHVCAIWEQYNETGQLWKVVKEGK